MDLNKIYHRLFAHFGPRGWWPGESSYEHLIGCILAQNTNWDRVVPVIERMKEKEILRPEKFLQLEIGELAEILKGSGTYQRKAKYLQNAGRYMLSKGWNGAPDSISEETQVLRKELLGLKGIGPETCDCILLYVLERPVFVVDSYTSRILSRHELCTGKAKYGEIQELFHYRLSPGVEMFKEFHALLVDCAKQYCRPNPKCAHCPLNEGKNRDNQKQRNSNCQKKTV